MEATAPDVAWHDSAECMSCGGAGCGLCCFLRGQLCATFKLGHGKARYLHEVHSADNRETFEGPKGTLELKSSSVLARWTPYRVVLDREKLSRFAISPEGAPEELPEAVISASDASRLELRGAKDGKRRVLCTSLWQKRCCACGAKVAGVDALGEGEVQRWKALGVAGLQDQLAPAQSRESPYSEGRPRRAGASEGRGALLQQGRLWRPLKKIEFMRAQSPAAGPRRAPAAAGLQRVVGIAELTDIEGGYDVAWFSLATLSLTDAACEQHNGCEQHESDSEECELDCEQHETGTEEHEQCCGQTVKTLKGHEEFEQPCGQTTRTPTGTLGGDVENEQACGPTPPTLESTLESSDERHEPTALRRAHLAAEAEGSVHDGAQRIGQSGSFRGRAMAALRFGSPAEVVEGGPYLVLLSFATEGVKEFGVDGALSALRASATLAQELGGACVQMGRRREARSSVGDCVRFSRIASSVGDKTHALFPPEAEQPAQKARFLVSWPLAPVAPGSVLPQAACGCELRAAPGEQGPRLRPGCEGDPGSDDPAEAPAAGRRHAAPSAPFRALLSGVFGGRYEPGGYLGRGASATVWEAVHADSQRRVAVKCFERNGQDSKKQALREMRVLSKIRHPRVLEAYEVIETSSSAHLVCEHVDGESLRALVRRQPGARLCEDRARGIYEQIVEGVSYCHDRLVVHRDLKMENVLLDRRRRSAKIIDFGFAAQVASRAAKLRTFCGTPSYMAPEIVRGELYSGFAADMWALGVLLFALLVGSMPFTARTEVQLYAKIRRGGFAVPESLAVLPSRIVKAAMRPDPASRPSAAAVLRHSWLAGAGAEAAAGAAASSSPTAASPAASAAASPAASAAAASSSRAGSAQQSREPSGSPAAVSPGTAPHWASRVLLSSMS
ncbi:unnamed protein product [Prorocentrum cordatum]|uniref:Protein kinase domain-containing protein n=1 Tax=Prorocentrum cordatum TaxID=2364126 RepID=A0ABN9S1R1_9DINO|nr:unnamed protein product [Polarella glacialis]